MERRVREERVRKDREKVTEKEKEKVRGEGGRE